MKLISQIFVPFPEETLKRKGDDEEAETPEVPEKRVKTDEAEKKEAVVEAVEGEGEVEASA